MLALYSYLDHTMGGGGVAGRRTGPYMCGIWISTFRKGPSEAENCSTQLAPGCKTDGHSTGRGQGCEASALAQQDIISRCE